jgi:hypothetical protein
MELRWRLVKPRFTVCKLSPRSSLRNRPASSVARKRRSGRAASKATHLVACADQSAPLVPAVHGIHQTVSGRGQQDIRPERVQRDLVGSVGSSYGLPQPFPGLAAIEASVDPTACAGKQRLIHRPTCKRACRQIPNCRDLCCVPRANRARSYIDAELKIQVCARLVSRNSCPIRARLRGNGRRRRRRFFNSDVEHDSASVPQVVLIPVFCFPI